MRISRIERRFGVLWLAGAIALLAAAATTAEAGKRKAVAAKTSDAGTQATSAQPQKPIRLRYFGGPKGMMSPE